ncbi:hypothetical protein D3C79_982420 [compost metagenome]
MQTATLTTGQLAHAFALIDALEVKAADIGTAWHFCVAHAHDVLAAGHFFPHGFGVIHAVAELIDGSQLDGIAQHDTAGIRLLLAGHHAEQRGFTRAVRTDDADNRALRYGE